MADSSNWYRRTEYLDPVVAEGLGLSFSGLAPKGRYYGFDQIEAGVSGDGIPIILNHATFCKWSNISNVQEEYALVVSPHGTFLYNDGGFAFDIPINGSPNERIYLFYVRYTWNEAEGGALPLVNYLSVVEQPARGDDEGLEALLPDPATDTAIGFLTVAIGGDSINDLTWEPLDTPAFAGTTLDLSIYALLAGTNKFTKTQAWGEQTLTQTAITAGGLLIQNTGNVVKLNIAGSSSIELHSMVDAFSSVGSMFILYGYNINMTGGSTLKWVDGGNIVFPDNFLPVTIETDDTFIFLKETVSSYRMIAAFQTNVKTLADLATSIYGLEVALDDKASLTYRNQFAGLQEFSAQEVGTVSDGYIIIPDTGNEFRFQADINTTYTIKGIKRTNGSHIRMGTIIGILFTDVKDGSTFTKCDFPSYIGFNITKDSLNIQSNCHYLFQRTYNGVSLYDVMSIHLDARSLDTPWETIAVGSGFSYAGIDEVDQLKIRRTWDGAIEIDGKIGCANLDGEIIGTFTTPIESTRVVPLTQWDNSVSAYAMGFAKVSTGQLEFFNNGGIATDDILEIHVKIYFKP